MDFSIEAIWASMGLLAKGVAAILLVMAVSSLGVFVERWLMLTRATRRARICALEAAPLIDARELERAKAVCEGHVGLPLADLLSTGLGTYLRGLEGTRAGRDALTPVELSRRAIARRLEALAAEQRRGFSVLASVGSVSPFVGLFGTVVGIINAFEGIARTGSGGLGAVSAGIAEALIVTAFGLAVAIPAVLAFNFLSTRAERVDLALQQAAGELIDALENGHTTEPKS
ncbi:MAG: tolQ protein [Myxococcales bacterium]|nr:tolQ protein [Myxococcales bacterium]